MPVKNIDISVIVTAHNEGRLAHRTMQSLFLAVNHAKENGLCTDILVVLDTPNRGTVEYFAAYNKENIRVEKVAFGDPGLSRNFGVSLSKGKYIAFLDADNLFSEFWLYKAFYYLETSSFKVIVHPEYHVIFEMTNMISRQKSSLDPEFHPTSLLESNCWDTVCMAKREVFLDNPFAITTKEAGFGYEDWHFNCETLANGIEHSIVPDTAHFVRRKKTGSQMLESFRDNRVLRPTKLFEPQVFSSFIQSRKKKSTQNNDPPVSVSIKTHFVRRIYRHRRKFKKPVEFILKTISKVNPHLEPLSKGLVESFKSLLVPKELIPQWLLKEWRSINRIEPQLYPERRLISNISCYTVPESRIGNYYLELCQLYGEKISHVFLIPWLKRGGADLAAINYIEALAANPLVTGITVISCQNSDSPWINRLPANVNFIEFGRICKGLASEEQETLLTRLLLQMAPSVVHNINSDLGYRIISKYGLALINLSRLYVSSYCDDITQEGKIVGYPSKYLPECFDLIQGVLCDCNFFADMLHERFAFDKRKLFVHYQPCQVKDMRVYSAGLKNKDRIDVLWASRLDRQKRPDILANIAEACKNLPVTFHVYGASLLGVDIYSAVFKKLPNVKYYGPFDGLFSLPIENFDIFLYTTQWDGLPNILLEALCAGLPIIAPDVCGIGELIVNNETGFLIEKYDDVDAYVECLKGILKDSSSLCELVIKAQFLLNERHSMVNFTKQLTKLPGYLQ